MSLLTQHSKRGYQGALVPKHLGGFKKSMFNMDSQLAHEIFGLPQSYGFQLEAACMLNTSKGSFRPVGHSRVAGCKTRLAIAKQ